MVQIFMMFISLAFAKNYITAGHVKITDNTPQIQLTAPSHLKKSTQAIDLSFKKLSACKEFMKNSKKMSGGNPCWVPLKQIAFHCNRSRYLIGQSLRTLKNIMDSNPNKTTEVERQEKIDKFSHKDWLAIHEYKETLQPLKKKIVDCTRRQAEKMKVSMRITFLINAYEELAKNVNTLIIQLTPKNQNTKQIKSIETDSSS